MFGFKWGKKNKGKKSAKKKATKSGSKPVMRRKGVAKKPVKTATATRGKGRATSRNKTTKRRSSI